MDCNKIAQDILDNVGGKANVKQVTHCFTRLHFILKDEFPGRWTRCWIL